MTGAKDSKAPKARKAATREERLAEALRANMKRRKAQARARADKGDGKDTQGD